MPKEHDLLAIDLGAESRGTMLGSLAGEQLRLANQGIS